MEIGLFSWFTVRNGQSEHEAFREWFDLICMAEDLGVDCFWLAEFHFRPWSPISSPMVIASNVAARTKRIKLGMGVSLLPLANPVRLAEDAATLDHMSEGRLVYGIGRSSFMDGYLGYGIDYEESRPRFFEAIEVIRRAWGEGPFSYQGHFYNFERVNVVPKPYQKPHPEVRVACESAATFPMMGKLGFPILIRHQVEIAEIQRRLREYDEERFRAGFSGPRHVTLQTSSYLCDSTARARDVAASSLAYQASVLAQLRREQESMARTQQMATTGSATREDMLRLQLFGTPEETVDRIQEYKETLGIEAISLQMNPGGQIPRDEVVTSMRLLMEKVAPRIR